MGPNGWAFLIFVMVIVMVFAGGLMASEYNQQSNELTDIKATATQSVNACMTNNSGLQATAQAKDVELKTVQDNLKKISDEKNALTQKVTDDQAEIARLNGLVGSLQAQLDKKNADTAQKDQQNKDLVAQYNNQIRDLNDTITQKDKIILEQQKILASSYGLSQTHAPIDQNASAAMPESAAPTTIVPVKSASPKENTLPMIVVVGVMLAAAGGSSAFILKNRRSNETVTLHMDRTELQNYIRYQRSRTMQNK